jgi:hypothetical protein
MLAIAIRMPGGGLRIRRRRVQCYWCCRLIPARSSD